MTRGVLITAYDLTTGEAAKLAGVDRATVRRWGTRGVRVNGRRVTLDLRRVGGEYRTSRAAMADFDQACNPGDGRPAVPGSPAEATASEAARYAAAMATLARMT